MFGLSHGPKSMSKAASKRPLGPSRILRGGPLGSIRKSECRERAESPFDLLARGKGARSPHRGFGALRRDGQVKASNVTVAAIGQVFAILAFWALQACQTAIGQSLHVLQLPP